VFFTAVLLLIPCVLFFIVFVPLSCFFCGITRLSVIPIFFILAVCMGVAPAVHKGAERSVNCVLFGLFIQKNPSCWMVGVPCTVCLSFC